MLKALLGLFLAVLFARAPLVYGQDTAKTLAKLDASSTKFQSAQANYHRDLYNAVIKESTPQDGSVYVEGKGSSARGGMSITGLNARIMEYKNGVARVFNPAPAPGCYNTISLKNKGMVESFLALGFGGSGKDLASTWNITDQGPEIMSSDGKKIQTEKLDLVPKDDSVKGTVTHVTMWLDLDRAISLKQIIYSPTGDTQTATYSNIRLNAKLDTKPFDFKSSPCK